MLNKQLGSQKRQVGYPVLAFLLLSAMVFGALQLLGKPQITYAAGLSMTEFAVPTARSGPEGVTRGPDGNLWFTEYFGNKIGRITPEGTITEFAVPTAQSLPANITSGPDGNLWFTESWGNQIGRITPAGAVTEFAVLTANGGPEGITSGPDGNLWFTEASGHTIGRITPEGVITEYSIGSNPWEITVGPDGNLWFTQDQTNQIGQITPLGVVTEFAAPTDSSDPTGISAGPDGNLWFTESRGNQIGRITPAGAVTEFAVPTANSDPTGITIGPDGNLWFAEYGGNQIGQITLAGVVTEFAVPTAGGTPTGITIGPDGNLWFTEEQGNQVGRVNLAETTPPSGKWLKPANGFKVTEGTIITLSVQANPDGTPIVDVIISATWSGSSGKICDLKKPDKNTMDHYSCTWSFVVAGSYIPAGSVTFHMTITDQNGNQVSDPDGSRTGAFNKYNPQRYSKISYNWGGYYDYGRIGGTTLYSDVKATWTVPALQSCGSSEVSKSVIWVGLGGVDKDSYLEQIGSASDCSNGQSVYFAWWEMVQPGDKGRQPIAHQVNQGDTIVAEVKYKGKGVYHLSISDNRVVLFSQDQQGYNNISDRNAVDWIVEAPLVNGQVSSLANYGMVTFTSCQVDGKPMTYGPTLFDKMLIDQQRNPLESVSDLNGTDNGFSVSWDRAT